VNRKRPGKTMTLEPRNSTTSFRYYYSRVSFLIWRYRRLLAFGVLALLATDATQMTIPWLIGRALDAALRADESGAARFWVPILIVLTALFQGAFRYLWRTNIYGFSRRIEWDLRNTVFGHLEKLPFAYFQRMRTGDLMSRLTNDIQAVRELLGFGSLAVFDATVVVAASVTLMLAIDTSLTFYALLPMLLITVTVRYFGRRIFHSSYEVQQHLSHLSNYVQENISGIRVIQAYGQEANQQAGFKRASTEYLRRNLELSMLWSAFWPLIRVFSGLSALIILWLGGRQIIQGALTLGEFLAFNSYLLMLAWPLMAFGHLVNQYQRGAAALTRLFEILDTRVASPYEHTGVRRTLPPETVIDGHIEVRDLTFQPDDAPSPLLEHVSFTIRAGQTCGIVGEVGAGKTTLVNLLLRLHEPPSGSIFMDGVDIRDIPIETLRRAVGYVSQDVFLFSATVRENLWFGANHDAQRTPCALEKAAEKSLLLSTISEFSDGFETRLGERGVRLSGGQRQRLALARALVRGPSVLVLDDAFSSVDTETEDGIFKNLRRDASSRCTTILISHRLSTLKGADLILYLERGRIVERGSHEYLLTVKGKYANMFRRQQLTSLRRV
jgi:ATP-binding cassette subfamily B multidrug efflux pump